MGAKGFTDEYLKTRSATFGELTRNLLAQDAKSAYKQAAIIMLRNAFADLELCGGEKEQDTRSNCSIPVVSGSASECKCTTTKHVEDTNAYPYGDHVSYDECVECKKVHNFIMH